MIPDKYTLYRPGEWFFRYQMLDGTNVYRRFTTTVPVTLSEAYNLAWKETTDEPPVLVKHLTNPAFN